MANETVTGEYSVEIQLIAGFYPAAPKILAIPTFSLSLAGEVGAELARAGKQNQVSLLSAGNAR